MIVELYSYQNHFEILFISPRQHKWHIMAMECAWINRLWIAWGHTLNADCA